MLKKILLSVTGLLVLGLVALAAAIGYTADCPTTATDPQPDGILAARYYCYGPPEVIEVTSVAAPDVAADEVLVQVSNAGVNPLDWHYLRGAPYILRLLAGIGSPSDNRLGVDFAGTVIATGDAVTGFSVGDRVFGGATGAFGQLVTRREGSSIARLPDNIRFEQGAGVSIAGSTALQALRDHGRLKAGERVLINGASGGVGTFAVQIAKAMGAHVTGVCSGRNTDMVRDIGADAVINYKTNDYTLQDARYDLIVDMVGNHSPLDNQAVLTPNGRLVIVGGKPGNWIGPFTGVIKAMLADLFTPQDLLTMTATINQADLQVLAEMMAAGAVTPVIDRHYALSEVRDAIDYSESGRARGKIILDIPPLDAAKL
ncbi:MAG: NAD(P)-dependent alcohol dehydrogenase [Halieaceae bacterium]|nr:NAD(P)-dependent alcohol dehydrogenase [Halieaceae bacterium]